MLASLSTPTEGIEKRYHGHQRNDVIYIETLKAQEKFEYEKFLDMQRREENERRRGREDSRETRKR